MENNNNNQINEAEVVKALKCLSHPPLSHLRNCKRCPYCVNNHFCNREKVAEDAIYLINSLHIKAEKRLKEERREER